MERSPGEGNGYALQYSGLENSMDCTAQGHKEWGTTEPLSLFMLVLLLVLETFLPFSTVTTPIYLFTSSVQGSLFSTSSPTFVIEFFLRTAILTGVRQQLLAVLIGISLTL